MTKVPDSLQLIEDSLAAVKQIYLDDTDSSINQLESLRQLNTTTTLKYIKKEEDLKVLERKVEKISAINAEIDGLFRQLDSIEKTVDFVSSLTEELERLTENW